MPAKRGRPAKADATEAVEEPPRKRGRLARVQAEAAKPAAVAIEVPKRGRRANAAPEPVVNVAPAEPIPKKRSGRPRKAEDVAPAQEEVPAPTRRAGRFRKEQVVAPVKEEETAPKKRIGRPPKSEQAPTPTATRTTPRRGRPAAAPALDLHRPVGSSRVAKRVSARTQAPQPTATVAPRMNPRLRSKLRARALPVSKPAKPEPVVRPAKRGRPRKSDVVAPAPTTKRNTARAAIPEPVKPAKPAKTATPRKPRGHTMLKVADRFVDQVQQYYESLMNGEPSSATAVEDEQENVEEEDAEDNVEAEEEPVDPISDDSESLESEDENQEEQIQIAEAVAEAEDDAHYEDQGISGQQLEREQDLLDEALEQDLPEEDQDLSEQDRDWLEQDQELGHEDIDEDPLAEATYASSVADPQIVEERAASIIVDLDPEAELIESDVEDDSMVETAFEMDIHEQHLQLKQDGEDSVVVREEVDTKLVMHDDDMPEDGIDTPQSLLNGDDNYVQEALRPSAASIFG